MEATPLILPPLPLRSAVTCARATPGRAGRRPVWADPGLWAVRSEGPARPCSESGAGKVTHSSPWPGPLQGGAFPEHSGPTALTPAASEPQGNAGPGPGATPLSDLLHLRTDLLLCQ